MNTKELLQILTPANWPGIIALGFLWCITRLPIRWQFAIGKWLGKLIYHTAKKLRTLTEINIKICFPELDQDQQKILVKKNFVSLGIGLIETAMAWWLSDKRLKCLVKLNGLNYVEEAFAKGNGIILLGPHSTCLEMVGRLLGARYSFAVMYRPHKKKLLSLVQERFRKKYRIEQIARHEMRKLLRALKNNIAVWYAYDVDAGEKRSVFANFFGIPTASLTAVSRIVNLSNAAVVPISYYRLENEWGYEINLEHALENFPSKDLIKDAERLNEHLEKAIRMKPEEYIWQYKRFKTRPFGENRFY